MTIADIEADTPQGAALRAAYAEYGPPRPTDPRGPMPIPLDHLYVIIANLPQVEPPPACCVPSVGAETAEALYCAYQRGGPPERAGLAWDGRPCPTWAELVARQEAGDAGASGVVAKWRAVAELVRVTS